MATPTIDGESEFSDPPDRNGRPPDPMDRPVVNQARLNFPYDGIPRPVDRPDEMAPQRRRRRV